MVTPHPPFLSARDVREIHDAMGAGFATVQAIQDPAVTITPIRRAPHDVGGWLEGQPIDLIRISLTNRDPVESGPNAGAVETSTVGQFRAWAPIDCKHDDRFTWAGRVCAVDQVNPERFGVVSVQFHLLEGAVTP